MRVSLIVASIVCSILLPPRSEAAGSPNKKPASSRKVGLSIRVEGDGWGSARKHDIETVLYAVADELLTRLPARLNVPIVVSHTEGSPVALYDRGPGKEYQVELHAKGTRWQEYAYEFAHELCHIMSNYDQNLGADTGRYNQWFEETLCEAASLYALKGVAGTWEASGPGSAWYEQAPQMRGFVDDLIREGHRQLPPQTPLAAWLRGNEDRMRSDPYQRQRNEVVANLLLPLFEASPENWDALSYLNLDPADARNSLREYLHNWYDNAPAQHKEFVFGVLALLGVEAEDRPTASVDEGSPREAPEAEAAVRLRAGHAGPIQER
jgi:hypothetical protein